MLNNVVYACDVASSDLDKLTGTEKLRREDMVMQT
jgi:hypothetical protein